MLMLANIFPDPVSSEKIKSDLLNHYDWSELDKGTLSCEEAIKRANERTGIPLLKIRELFDEVPKRLTPKQDTLNLIRELRRKKHKIYVLSNMFSEVADYLENEYSFWDLFDGIVFSARIKLIKPSPEIFHYILNRFNLIPEETVFLDDMQENVDAAVREGINGILFKSADQAKKELRNLEFRI